MKLRRIATRRPAGASGAGQPARSTSCRHRLHPVLRRVYAARGIARCRRTLARTAPPAAGVDARRHRPRDGTAAGPLARGSRILVAGDFDADGATSTALVMRQLARARPRERSTFRVPDRMRHGYGLTPALVADLAHEKAGPADHGRQRRLRVRRHRGRARARHRGAGDGPPPAGRDACPTARRT